MKYYWINIDNYLDRNENMREQFSKYNLENYRIKAFTPDDMESIKIKKHSKANSPDNVYCCILSHLKAIKQGYEDGDEYFYVCEDDINLINLCDKKINNLIKNYMNNNNCNIDLLQISNSSNIYVLKYYNDYIKTDELIVKKIYDIPSTEFYLISRKGAKKILDTYIVNYDNLEFDLSLYEWCAADNLVYKILNTYILCYPLITSDIKFGSTIHPEHLRAHEDTNKLIKHIHTIDNKLDLFVKDS